MMRNMRSGKAHLFKQGTKLMTGMEEVVFRNIEACQKLTNLTRTSLGPNGMNKMVINHLDKLFVTNDAATIIRETEVEHPAAKLLVLASEMQEREIGDGSNFVITFAGELLGKAAEMLRLGLHTTELIKGFKLALAEALKIIPELMCFEVVAKELLTKELLAKGVRSAISSKQFGMETFLSILVAEAAMCVMPKNARSLNVDNVRIVKVLGGSVDQSEVVKGMVIDRGTGGSVRHLKDACIAVFGCSLGASDTETKGTVLIKTADELLNYTISEEKSVEDKVKALVSMGVNMVITSQPIDDVAAHFLEKYKIMSLKLSSQWQMRRIARTVKARILVQLYATPEDLGYCSTVDTKELGPTRLTVFKQEKEDATQVSTVLLRASTESILKDVERAIDDGINTVKAMTKDARFVMGGGASELELARRLHLFGETCQGLDQYAVKAFADSLEVIPRTLAENAGLNAMDVVAGLYAEHEKKNTSFGVNVEERKVADMASVGIFDLLATKAQALKLATDAAVTILSVDQLIMSKPAGGPKMGKRPGQGHWDEEEGDI